MHDPLVHDAVDRQLLVALQRDGRRSVASLAEEVALSAPAVKRRVDRLRATGAIRRFTADVDPGALGWTVEAFVDAEFGPRTTTREIARWLSEHPEVVGAWTVTGSADVHLHVRATDHHHLEDLLNRLRTDAGVLRTQTVVVLSSVV